jgi:hypothetical protein
MAEARQFEFNLDQLWAFSRGDMAVRAQVRGRRGRAFAEGAAR